MCTTVHPPIAHADKLPLGAKVFIEGKNRPLHVTDSFTEVSLQMGDSSRSVIHVTNLSGEPTTIPMDRVVSAVEPINAPKPVDISGFSMQGYGLKIKGLFANDWMRNVVREEDLPDVAVIVAEDLAEAEIALVNIQTGAVLWANPACDPRSVKRAVKIARLTAEVMVLDNEFNTPRPGTTPGISPAAEAQPEADDEE